MDLSKAFDCLPHTLLLAKLEAYGLDDNTLKLILSYLSSHKQCDKKWRLFEPVQVDTVWCATGANFSSNIIQYFYK